VDLYGAEMADAIRTFRAHRLDFLSKSSRERATQVYEDGLLVQAPASGLEAIHNVNLPSRRCMTYRVPEINPLLPLRCVCRATFQQYYPVSIATLKRVMHPR
jgi:hypothetical protein